MKETFLTKTARITEKGTVHLPEEILYALEIGVEDLISFVKDGDAIKLIVKHRHQAAVDQTEGKSELRNVIFNPVLRPVAETR